MKTKIKFPDYRYKRNYNRIFILSDIHNRYDCFKQMKEKLSWGKNDLVIIDGDFVDRGGQFADPVGLLHELWYGCDRNYDVIVIKGNHEKWLSDDIKYFLAGNMPEIEYNTFYILMELMLPIELKEFSDWLDELPLGIEMKVSGFRKPFRIAHASTLYGFKNEHEATMGSSDFHIKALKDMWHTHIVGHTTTPEVRFFYEEYETEPGEDKYSIFRIDRRVIYIDCGNGCRHEGYGKLGCIELTKQGKILEHYV
jgi:predicted MPP superfamily phosphohydrolase